MRIFCQISIHALRVEGDSHKYITYTDLARISIHALRVEGDSRYLPSKLRTPTYFYPRPPGGGRPVPSVKSFIMYIHFYPRPPGGGRRNTPELSSFMQGISIHALRVEGDRSTRPCGLQIPVFLSTPSGWRATAMRKASNDLLFIFLSTPSGWRATCRTEAEW